MDQAFLFNNGLDYMSYNLLGAFPAPDVEGQSGYRFAVWAPHARQVAIAGTFNNWSVRTHPMERLGTTGIWTGFVAGVKDGELYKYAITTPYGHTELKADPFARWSELRPNTASVLYDPDDYSWHDDSWLDRRPHALSDFPLNIYEVHLGSWRCHEDGSFLNYREIALQLADYVLDMGYNTVELMPISEHPLDASWGYQVTGYYSVTSRFGSPADFKFLVDHLHQKGIRVILDWVPAHFPRDAFGLAKFDGTPLFEYADVRMGEHMEWGTLVFDFSKKEVVSFLVSNAFFWLREFHIDGLRVDAVSSMLYRNYGRTEYVPNVYGGTENIEAIDFLRHLNGTIRAQMPGVLMVAEESTAWPHVTESPENGGLGFTHKWNMGWMHDTLDYMGRDYVYRKWHQSQLSFSLMYAFSERFILPFSHDEVVHGKRSLLDRMPGDLWKKFANLRALYTYYMAHPGGKLMFMGGEFGQFIEWRFYEQLEWFLLEYENHRLMHQFVRTMNHAYLDQPAFWADDHDWSGFEWISADDADNSVYIFARKALAEDKLVVTVINLTPNPLPQYRFGVPRPGTYKILLNSDSADFGGSGYDCGDQGGSFTSIAEASHGQEQSLVIQIPPLCGLLLEFQL
ncbi:MAG: 1,4-alpha-glucan branching protein GlgB [Clostridia bacterium]|nr:1,4-alpha-glucan branching protein GlgB [Clostridia bacterium]